MSTARHRHVPAPHSPRRRSALALAGTFATIGAMAAIVAAMALAASASPTVSTSSNAKLKESILVNSQGRTLYVLTPETASHLLCKSAECLKLWPPLTVSSPKAKLQAGPGVHGKLAILRRSDGMLQVTLKGLPLYRFQGDLAKGQVNGQGLKSFGGTWNVVPVGDPRPKSGSGSPSDSGGGW